MYFFGNANISYDNENIQLITKYTVNPFGIIPNRIIIFTL